MSLRVIPSGCHAALAASARSGESLKVLIPWSVQFMSVTNVGMRGLSLLVADGTLNLRRAGVNMSSPRNPELISAPSTASRASAGRHAWAVDCAGHPALSSFDAARRARQCRSSRSEPPRFASRRARPPTENGHEAKTATMRLRSRRLLAAALICAASLAALPVEASSRAQRPLAQRAATSAPRAARLDRAFGDSRGRIRPFPVSPLRSTLPAWPGAARPAQRNWPRAAPSPLTRPSASPA